MRRWADHPAAAWVLAGLALVLAAAGARPFAGGYNDGSRLATAESLIDRGTLAIDDSVFLGTQAVPDAPLVYRSGPPLVPIHGTLDRVRIDGHFYSDKPMVPAVLTAGAYRVLMAFGLPRPDERPDVFCRVATILTCGLGYAAAVGCLWVLGTRAGLAPVWRLVWLAGFALATVLPAYTRHVNSGVPQAAAVAGLAVLLSRAAGAVGHTPWGSLAGAGFLAGFGYTLDGGSGPPLLAAAVLAVIVRTRRIAPTAVFLLAALPWVAAHHALNHAVGRVWVPLGMVPEFLDWPGSPFNESNMTGVARHSASGLAAYAFALLLGTDGFLLFNLPLLLAVAAGWLVLLRRGPDRVELAALVGWCVVTWAVYVVLSDNAGGGCLSVRWFVPFLVPGFWVLARLLAERPTFRWDFLALAGWGLVIGWQTWLLGPWPFDLVPDMRPIAWAALGTWAAVRGVEVVRRLVRPG
ncbi:MAG TPA: hypothetical protein VKE74_19010 [Gemmataceae bacterium]|nr:hypothetical protein [Gemmataceae bacterium]